MTNFDDQRPVLDGDPTNVFVASLFDTASKVIFPPVMSDGTFQKACDFGFIDLRLCFGILRGPLGSFHTQSLCSKFRGRRTWGEKALGQMRVMCSGVCCLLNNIQ
jgi:hypothetical protein